MTARRFCAALTYTFLRPPASEHAITRAISNHVLPHFELVPTPLMRVGEAIDRLLAQAAVSVEGDPVYSDNYFSTPRDNYSSLPAGGSGYRWRVIV